MMITKEILKKIAPGANEKIISDLEHYFDEYLQKYNINTYLRVCHFLAQCAHESANFRTLEEYATGAAYEGRKDLGNVNPGDGRRYKGRGIIQLTGRANYRTYGQRLGYPLEDQPLLAMDPKVSVQTACEYWNSKNLSEFADKDDLLTITKRINGGTNGLDDRKAKLALAKQVIPKTFSLNKPPAPEPVNPLIPPIVVAKKGDNSPYVADLQNMLIKKGWAIAADGAFGPKTEQAVKEFQQKNSLSVTGQIDTDTLNRLMM
jgi:putative chitinase